MTAARFPAWAEVKQVLLYWVLPAFIYTIVLFLVLLVRHRISILVYDGVVSAATWASRVSPGRGPIALPPDNESSVTPTATMDGETAHTALEASAPPPAKPFSWLFAGPVMLSVVGIGFAVCSLRAMNVDAGPNGWQKGLPLGIHWLCTEVLIAASYLQVLIWSLAFLWVKSHTPNQVILLARTTQVYGIQNILLPVATHVVSLGVAAIPLLPVYPYSDGLWIILVAVVAQPVSGLVLFFWGCAVRWRLELSGVTPPSVDSTSGEAAAC